MPLHGRAYWPGVGAAVSASYTCGHGSTPGVASLAVPWQPLASVPRDGVLRLTDGVNPPVTLIGCHVERVDPVDGEGGVKLLNLTILDRRHTWRFGSIDGAFNQIDRFPDPSTIPVGRFVTTGGPFVPGLERTPAQLIAACCQLLGIPVEFRGVPTADRPPVTWRAANPARAAEAVAEAVGCRLVFQPLNNTVLIVPPGGLAKLDPTFPILSETPGQALPATPTDIEVVGGDAQISDFVKLEAVGYEEDGRLRRIEDLSYAPRGFFNGFGTITVPKWWDYHPDQGHYLAVTAGDSASVEVSRALTKQFVWRLFRVSGVPLDVLAGRKEKKRDGFQYKPVRFGAVRNRRQVRLSDALVTTEIDAQGQPIVMPAYVRANCVNCYDPRFRNRAGTKNFAEPNDPAVPFTVDADRGLVLFQRPIYRVREKDADGNDLTPVDSMYGPARAGATQYTLADVYLRCTCTILGADGMPFRGRWSQTVGFNAAGRLVETIDRPDLRPIFEVRRQLADMRRNDERTNEAELGRRAADALAQAVAKYADGFSVSRTYAGILPVQPDGAIRQVSWSLGVNRPPTTTVSVNDEHAAHLPTYAELRRNVRALDFLTSEHIYKLLNLVPLPSQ